MEVPLKKSIWRAHLPKLSLLFIIITSGILGAVVGKLFAHVPISNENLGLLLVIAIIYLIRIELKLRTISATMSSLVKVVSLNESMIFDQVKTHNEFVTEFIKDQAKFLIRLTKIKLSPDQKKPDGNN